MHTLSRRHALLALAAALAVPARAAPPAISKADRRRARALIEAQLAAFAADDAKRAFSYAAPGIRQQFENADHFMEMVRESYPAVYRPASVSFLEPERVDGELLQAVQLADADGALWLAIYQLERQRGGSLRISGCHVSRIEGRSI